MNIRNVAPSALTDSIARYLTSTARATGAAASPLTAVASRLSSAADATSPSARDDALTNIAALSASVQSLQHAAFSARAAFATPALLTSSSSASSSPAGLTTGASTAPADGALISLPPLPAMPAPKKPPAVPTDDHGQSNVVFCDPDLDSALIH